MGNPSDSKVILLIYLFASKILTAKELSILHTNVKGCVHPLFYPYFI